ncbi:site-specific integrase [Microcoleus sp. MON1_C5]|uniref:site-specific integrase n=1 Tax=Microcoleus sp. MON1_C5 TaxID=2818828 RepID=UPI002FCF688E
MRADKRPQSTCDVKVSADGNSLRLGFPKRHTPLWEMLDGKSLKGKPKYIYLTKQGFRADNPEDWKRAAQIAIAIEADLDHPEWEKLFDRTLAKYGLGDGKYAKLADVLQLPGAKQPEPEITVGEMWEDYLEWKQSQLEPSTFQTKFERVYTNALKGLVWNKKNRKYIDTENDIWTAAISNNIAEKILLIPLCDTNKHSLLLALNEAFIRATQLNKYNLPSVNPFFELWKKAKPDTRDKYKSKITDDGLVIEWWQVQDANDDDLEKDRRAFTKEERDIIITAFYESDKDYERQIAPLIEFLFLTGCRPGEAFALRWQDVMFERGIIRFSKSYAASTKTTQCTKTKTIRMFQLYPQLTDLLNRIKPDNFHSVDLVFQNKNGKSFNSGLHGQAWLGYSTGEIGGRKYHYSGVVKRLADEGQISGYLPPYHARHTYITLTAHANKENTSALMLLAHACGNSVEVILGHYLGVDKSIKLIQV